MNNFKPGDKVRLVSDCFKRPEWTAMNRKNRKFLAKYIGHEMKIGKLCDAVPHHVHTLLGTCIPAALLEPAEPTRLDGKNAAFCVIDELHDYKPNASDNTDLQYEVLDDHWCCRAGQIVTFYENDGDMGARFKWDGMPKSHDSVWLWWKWIRKCKSKPPKRVYTPEQTAEARDVSYRIIRAFQSDALQTIFVQPYTGGLERGTLDEQDHKNRGRERTIALALKFIGDEKDNITWTETDRAVSFCAPDDTWNDDVGICVSLCKLVGEPLPLWVRGGKS